MKQRILKSFFLFSFVLLLQTIFANKPQACHSKKSRAYVEPKTNIDISDIYIDEQLNILGDFKTFNDSYIKTNADQNADMRITGSTTLLGLITLPATAKNTLANALSLVIDSVTGSVGVSSSSSSSTGGVIPFSSGAVISGASVLPAQPRLLGFGSSAIQTIDGAGASTQPSEVGGFSFVVPFDGTISNLQVSTDLFVVTSTLLNSTGLQYDFTVLVSPSTPNNGTDHVSSTYATTALTASTPFGALAGTAVLGSTFRTCTNINAGSISVSAGDRVAVRVRMLTTGNGITDGLIAAQVAQISFAASVNYIPD